MSDGFIVNSNIPTQYEVNEQNNFSQPLLQTGYEPQQNFQQPQQNFQQPQQNFQPQQNYPPQQTYPQQNYTPQQNYPPQQQYPQPVYQQPTYPPQQTYPQPQPYYPPPQNNVIVVQQSNTVQPVQQPIIVVNNNNENDTDGYPRLQSGVAIMVLILNIFFPGIGTIIMGCAGGVNAGGWICIGIIQLCLAFFLIGWIWAIITGLICLKWSR